jgi:hypothetical protein
LEVFSVATIEIHTLTQTSEERKGGGNTVSPRVTCCMAITPEKVTVPRRSKRSGHATHYTLDYLRPRSTASRSTEPRTASSRARPINALGDAGIGSTSSRKFDLIDACTASATSASSDA